MSEEDIEDFSCCKRKKKKHEAEKEDVDDGRRENKTLFSLMSLFFSVSCLWMKMRMRMKKALEEVEKEEEASLQRRDVKNCLSVSLISCLPDVTSSSSLSSFFMSVVLPLKINGLLSLLVLWCQALFTEDTSLLTCLINDQVLVQMKYDLSLPFFLCFPSALHLLHLKTSCEGNFIFSMSSLLSEKPLSLHLLLSFSRIGRKPRLMSCIERVKRIRDQGCSSFFFLS